MVRERAAAADRRLPLRRDRPAGDADFDVRSDCGGAAGRVAGSLGNRRIAGVGLERRAPATGLLLFLMLGLSLPLRGPFAYADASDLAGGTSAEASGQARARWPAARLAMLVSRSD